MVRVDRDTIVVGLDTSPCSDRALDWAVDEALRSNRRLLLVSVWHWSTGVVGSPMSLVGHQDPFTAAREILARGARHARSRGAPTTTFLAEGSTACALTDIANEAAMLVVGRHGGGTVRRTFMGSVSRGCVEHSHIPVVVIPAA